MYVSVYLKRDGLNPNSHITSKMQLLLRIIQLQLDNVKGENSQQGCCSQKIRPQLSTITQDRSFWNCGPQAFSGL